MTLDLRTKKPQTDYVFADFLTGTANLQCLGFRPGEGEDVIVDLKHVYPLGPATETHYRAVKVERCFAEYPGTPMWSVDLVAE